MQERIINMTDIQFQRSACDAKLRQDVAVLSRGHILTLMRKFGDDDNAISYDDGGFWNVVR